MEKFAVDSVQPSPPSSSSSPPSLPLIKRKELIFEPNHAHTAMLLGDMDNDGQHELIIGSLDGNLAIFKGLENAQPWAQGTGLGMIRTLVLGRIWPWLEEPQQLVAITVDGDVHVFLSPPSSPAPDQEPWKLVPVITEGVEPNVTTALIADIDDDGECELVLGRADGQILVFGWRMGLGDTGKPQMWEKTGGQVSAAVMAISIIGGDSGSGPQREESSSICLVAGLETGTVEILDCRDEMQQGGGRGLGGRSNSLVRFAVSVEEDEEGSGEANDESSSLPLVDIGIGGGLPLPHCGWCGPLVCCPVGSPSTSTAFGIAGLDGRLALGEVSLKVEENQHHQQQQQRRSSPSFVSRSQKRPRLEWRTTWSRRTAQPFFAISPFSINTTSSSSTQDAMEGAANEETTKGFAACGWSGMTWLASPSGEIMTFDASNMIIPPLRGFVAGRFDKQPCLLYSCADGRIQVFHDLQSQLSPSDKAAAGNALLQMKSKELRGLIKAWVDLHLGNSAAAAAAASSTGGVHHGAAAVAASSSKGDSSIGGGGGGSNNNNSSSSSSGSSSSSSSSSNKISTSITAGGGGGGASRVVGRES